jgi:voltage-gated potassium channel Kch
MIHSLSDHYIICGFGRVGGQVARDIRAAGAAGDTLVAMGTGRTMDRLERLFDAGRARAEAS